MYLYIFIYLFALGLYVVCVSAGLCVDSIFPASTLFFLISFKHVSDNTVW